MQLSKEIRDPIHGLIPVSPLEIKLIDTRVFQRLRKVRQLAMAYLGFPGTNHTRFEHGIGVMHVASRIALHLREQDRRLLSERDVENIRIAALLHDIGHGPFSHVSEYLLAEFLPEDSENVEEIHETISRRIITENREIVQVLGIERATEVANLLRTDIEGSLQHDIVSGRLDADKMDYLLRDSYYAGVKYGVFDLDRLINVLTFSDRKLPRLAVRAEGVEAVEQYVLAKYFITQQVYQHRVRRITDRMIIEGISQLIRSGDQILGNLYRYSQDPGYIDKYIEFNDHAVLDHIARIADQSSLGCQFFDRLEQRVLLKESYNEKLPFLLMEAASNTQRLEAVQTGRCGDLVERISEILKCDSRFTFVSLYSIKEPLPRKADPFFGDDQVLVRRSDGKLSPLVVQSVLFSRLVADAGNKRICVFSAGDSASAMKALDRQGLEHVLREYLEGR